MSMSMSKAPAPPASETSQGEAIDLSHHLSKVARGMISSPLTGLQKYFGRSGMISLAGGMPSSDYFPFDAISTDVLMPDSFSISADSEKQGPFSWIHSSRKYATSPITILKYPKDSADLNLATALQYDLPTGLPQLQQVVHEFTRTVYKPAYANFIAMLHTGNTDGWLKALLTLCNPGEGVLTSAWTYPSAIATMLPYGISPVPVPMDGQGMRSDSLRIILTSWDEVSRGIPRPHVMYLIPVGQNPTGATMTANRKKEIYGICVEFDIIIVEDDPYYFLQEGSYIPPSERSRKPKELVLDDEKYISSLSPSFLSFDYQGRVVRLDTFSKTIAPGCRLGWFTCNPIFAERLKRQAETSTLAPCGFGQSLVTALLLHWQPKGYLRWLKGLGAEYTRRRNFFLDCLVENFHLELRSSKDEFEGFDAYFASELTTSISSEKGYIEGPIFSFVPPTSGMFVWLQIHFDRHPMVPEVEEKSLELQLWIALAEAGVLVAPGKIFAADPSQGEVDGCGHFRISFSNAEYSDLKKAVVIFAKVVKEFFKTA